MKVPKKINILDIKPFKRAKSLSETEKEKKEDPNKNKAEEMPRTKFYLKKFTNFFTKTPAALTDKEERISKNRGNSHSMTTHTSNKIYPQFNPTADQQLEIVPEDDDKYDIDQFDKEILLDNSNKIQTLVEKKEMYDKVQHMIQAEEEDYVYLNNIDSEEDNENHDKKFKLMDSALMYEKELARVSNVEPFYSLFTQKKNPFEMNEMYSDRYPFLELRKKINFVRW